MNDFGNYLKELRGERSLRDVQKGTGISHTYLSTLEKGFDPRTKKQRKPTPETLKKLASYYDISYTTLLEKAGYISLEASVKTKADTSGDLSVTLDLFNLLEGERKVNFKRKPLTKEEKEKILYFIENKL
ncbi:helix-turn-helix domain-containing protein [Bacillus sp. FJAT-44742]|uniref:helix-turn-helix domain-containing protein n=1 Tax=Bacillus sp. FJAT-44742 TaxID=2014005 RepID=UPI000C248703|nr:helix-turn-helix domain-containing protein [Bacillus sp. FJAT-44742]